MYNLKILIPILVVGLLLAVISIKMVLKPHGNMQQAATGNVVVPGVSLDFIIPKTDVQGKDLDDVPRPSGFVRAEYREDKNPETGEVTYIQIVYRAYGNKFDEVYNFYKEEMQKKGWKLVSEETSNIGGSLTYEGFTVTLIKGVYLDFTREDENGEYDVYLNIIYGKVNNKEITEVSIEYNIYKKYESESETPYDYYKPIDSEPKIPEVPKYPDAIYYSTNQYTLGNAIFLEDDYYVNATVQDVYNFYSNKVPEGYISQGSSLQGSSGEVYYVSEDGSSMITVSIQEETTYGGGVIIKVMKTMQQQ